MTDSESDPVSCSARWDRSLSNRTASAAPPHTRTDAFHVRDRRSIEFAPTADGMSAVRNAKHLKMWLAAPKAHPLVWDPKHGSAPLDAINAALAPSNVTIGVMPVTLEPPTLHLDQRWPTA